MPIHDNAAKALSQRSTLTPEQLDVVGRIAFKLAELKLAAEFQPPVTTGPVISVFRFTPTSATKVSHLESISADIALTLGVEDVLVKRMPGESAVGFFVPNKERRWINFRDAVSALYTDKTPRSVPLVLGVDHLGEPVVEDLATLPHLLIAGQTGGGKSTLLAALLAACVYKVNSNDVQFVLSDTKGVEFGYFLGAPHLIFEVANSVRKTHEQLEWCIEETDRRLKKFANASVRNISDFNAKHEHEKLPRIVIVIDEMFDLLGGPAKEESKELIARIVARSRAAGIHFIGATQRPSVKVIDGDIKANFPARIALKTVSPIDSRTIINTEGAEHLIPPGDMLFLNPNSQALRRIHAPMVQIEDIAAAVDMACHKEAK